jgi:GntR family transcriptional regulator
MFSDGNLRLRPESHLPYYVQLKHLLQAEIRKSAPHTPLPSEQALQQQFEVSRPVVRQALGELAREGLIYRRKGKGSFVAPPKVMEGQVQSLTSLNEELLRQGYEPHTVVLQQELTEADPLVGEQLEIPAGSSLVLLRRLRLLEGEPFMVASTLLPRDLCPGLETMDLTAKSLYQVLATEYGLKIAQGSRTLEAVGASGAVAKELQVPIGAPLMHIELLSYEPGGRAFELSESYHRGDRAKFRFQLTQSATTHNSGVTGQ